MWIDGPYRASVAVYIGWENAPNVAYRAGVGDPTGVGVGIESDLYYIANIGNICAFVKTTKSSNSMHTHGGFLSDLGGPHGVNRT